MHTIDHVGNQDFFPRMDPGCQLLMDLLKHLGWSLPFLYSNEYGLTRSTCFSMQAMSQVMHQPIFTTHNKRQSFTTEKS